MTYNLIGTVYQSLTRVVFEVKIDLDFYAFNRTGLRKNRVRFLNFFEKKFEQKSVRNPGILLED